MTGGFQLPTAAPHKDGCRMAVQTGKVTTTEVCTAGTMSTVSVSKTVEHNRIFKGYKTLQAVTVNMTTFLSTDTDSVSFTLVLYISQAQGSQDFIFNHHQSSKPYICTGLTGTGPCSAEHWCTRTWSVYG